MDQELVEESQWPEIDAFGMSAILTCLENLQTGVILSIQGCFQNIIVLPSPNLKRSNESILRYCLNMLIQGLLRLTVSFPLECQLKVLLPWMLLLTWHQREFCLTEKCHLHLDNKARFLCFSLSKLRPPSLYDLMTASHFAKWFSFPPLFPSQKNFLMIFSKDLRADSGMRKQTFNMWGDRTELIYIM